MTMTVLRATAEQQQTLDVSPGVLGFLVTLAVVLACIPLFRSMTSKIRGVQYRDQDREPSDARSDAPADARSDAPTAASPDAGSGARPDAPPVA